MTLEELKNAKLVELPFKDGVSVFILFDENPDSIQLIIRGQPENEPGTNLQIKLRKNTMLMIMSIIMDKFDILNYSELLDAVDTTVLKKD